MKDVKTKVRAIRFNEQDDNHLQILALKNKTTVGIYLKDLVLKVLHSKNSEVK